MTSGVSNRRLNLLLKSSLISFLSVPRVPPNGELAFKTRHVQVFLRLCYNQGFDPARLPPEGVWSTTPDAAQRAAYSEAGRRSRSFLRPDVSETTLHLRF